MREEEKRKRREEERRKRKEVEKQKKISEKEIRIKVTEINEKNYSSFEVMQKFFGLSMFIQCTAQCGDTKPVLTGRESNVGL